MPLLAEDCTTTLEQNADYGFPESETSHIAGGEAPQNVATGTSQSGVEPVSGKLGRGEAGEPYDAGNADGMSDQSNCVSFAHSNTDKVLQDSATLPPTTLPPAAAQALDSAAVWPAANSQAQAVTVDSLVQASAQTPPRHTTPLPPPNLYQKRSVRRLASVAATSKVLAWAAVTMILDMAQLQSVIRTARSALPSVTDPLLTHTPTTQRPLLDLVDTVSVVTTSPAPTLETRVETHSLPIWALMSLLADLEVTLRLAA